MEFSFSFGSRFSCWLDHPLVAALPAAPLRREPQRKAPLVREHRRSEFEEVLRLRSFARTPGSSSGSPLPRRCPSLESNIFLE